MPRRAARRSPSGTAGHRATRRSHANERILGRRCDPARNPRWSRRAGHRARKQAWPVRVPASKNSAAAWWKPAGIFHQSAPRHADPDRPRRALGRDAWLDAWRIRPDPVHAEEHPEPRRELRSIDTLHARATKQSRKTVRI